ncbi:hypothetical protein ACP4OV_007104 [Aristida adscensionis]
MAGDERRRRVVLFPLPFQGHLSPMLHLAGLLRARGLAVTVLHTDFNAPDPARHPELAFLPIHETLPDEVASPGDDIVAQLIALNAACEAPFRRALASLLPGEDAAACAVVDGQWYAALRAAAQLGVPALALRTDSAATFRTMLAYPRLRDAGYVPIKEERLDEPVPGLEPLRARDLIRVDGSDAGALCGFVAAVAGAVRASASGVVLNTLEAVEAPELATIRRELSLPAFAVGPLHALSPSPSPAEQSLRAPDRGCLAWLDARPPRSVLYVSLGSVARVDRGAFEEMAWGLAGAGAPFLWVVRPGSVRGAGEDDEAPPPLPDGFEEEVAGRGKVVTWAPQREVLAHAAIAAFWTHCGWNSTMESLCEGMPMLAQPCFADQMANARYVTHQWGVGIGIGEVFERASVAEAVRKMMVGEDGARLRERARHLQRYNTFPRGQSTVIVKISTAARELRRAAREGGGGERTRRRRGTAVAARERAVAAALRDSGLGGGGGGGTGCAPSPAGIEKGCRDGRPDRRRPWFGGRAARWREPPAAGGGGRPVGQGWAGESQQCSDATGLGRQGRRPRSRRWGRRRGRPSVGASGRERNERESTSG